MILKAIIWLSISFLWINAIGIYESPATAFGHSVPLYVYVIPILIAILVLGFDWGFGKSANTKLLRTMLVPLGGIMVLCASWFAVTYLFIGKYVKYYHLPSKLSQRAIEQVRNDSGVKFTVVSGKDFTTFAFPIDVDSERRVRLAVEKHAKGDAEQTQSNP